MKKKATVKFNGGNGAILCDNCSVIVRTGDDFTEEEKRFMRGEINYIPPVYCKNCKNDES